MMRQDVLYLVAEEPVAHGVFDKPTETARKVLCAVRSVGMQEFYRARANGLRPSAVFILSDYAEYRGEKIALWTPPGGGQTRYQIVRTYVDGQSIELTAEEAGIDA